VTILYASVVQNVWSIGGPKVNQKSVSQDLNHLKKLTGNLMKLTKKLDENTNLC
jgi:hypothetical protein